MRYFGVDWGSSSLRLYRYDCAARVDREIECPGGILKHSELSFEEVLFDLLGEQVLPGDCLLLSGMITSRNGWVETEYIPTPARLERYLAGAVSRQLRGVELLFLPGVCQMTPEDVMRGEELQVFGVCSEQENALVILPGTHSKWVTVRNGALIRFRTSMTGELYSLLMDHSLLGMIAGKSEPAINRAFRAGLQTGAESADPGGSVLAGMFTARSRVLLGTHDPEEVSSYLSGVLIGHEIRTGLAACQAAGSEQVFLVGNAQLCARYAEGLRFLNQTAFTIVDTSAQQGYSRIIKHLGGLG